MNRQRTSVLLVTPGGTAPPGGATTIPAIRSLVEALAPLIDLHILTLEPPYEESSAPWTREHCFPGGPSAVKILRLSARIRSATRRYKVDIIHALWGLPSGLAAVSAFSNRPVILSLQGGETARLPDLGYGLQARLSTRFLVRTACRGSAAVILLSEHQRACASRLGLCSPDAPIIPLGVDQSLFSPSDSIPNVPPLRCIAVSTLSPLKDYPTMFRTVATIRKHLPVTLTVVGEDRMNGLLRQTAARMDLGDTVTFAGPVPHRRLPALYRSSHILLHTSLHETLPMVAVEAAACGVVPAGSDLGILADLSPECTITAPPGDHETLARRVLDAVADRTGFSRRRAETIRRVSGFTPDLTAETFRTLYESFAQTRE